ncbi:MAG: hypothetical protein ACKVT1_21250 [Dehalococcoidia bacterium]
MLHQIGQLTGAVTLLLGVAVGVWWFAAGGAAGGGSTRASSEGLALPTRAAMTTVVPPATATRTPEPSVGVAVQEASLSGPTAPATWTPARSPAALAGRPTSATLARAQTAAAGARPTPRGGCATPQNPWAFSLCGRGELVGPTPPDFCSYFPCIREFADGIGFVVLCANGYYSREGGSPEACEGEGGPAAALYTP